MCKTLTHVNNDNCNTLQFYEGQFCSTVVVSDFAMEQMRKTDEKLKL